ncbi:MAG: ribose-phosphate pyrophosphokinase [Armatimonadetes bacterium]|nr:ribose-phosphate pyrophosphokinase [Armatimonadota bacterium]
MEYGPLRIFTGNANPALAQAVATELEIEIGQAEVTRFADLEVRVTIKESVRGCDVFIVQPTCTPANDHLMELLVMIDACRRGSAGRITAVLPYYGYARQDKKIRGREPITAKLVANLITVAGADRVLCMDLHADPIMGFFDLPVDQLPARPIIASYCRSQGFGGDDTVVVSPDVGGVENAKQLADDLDSSLAIIAKRRPRPNEVEVIETIGQLEGRKALLVDDMVDTAGTLCQAAATCLERGAAEVHAVATHGVLSGPAIERIAASALKSVVITDTVPLPPEKQLPKITVLSVAPLLADAIEAIHEDRSVSRRLAQSPIRQQRMF